MEIKDFKKNKLFNRRVLILGIFKFFLFGMVIARLAYLQLFKNKEYSIRSDKNRIKLVIHPAPRGDIYDRNNVSLTKNNKNYKLLLYPRNKVRTNKLITKIIDILKLDQRQIDNILYKIKKNKSYLGAISLMENIKWDDLSRLEVNKYKLQDTAIEVGISRNYTFPFQNSHITGYVSLPTKSESINQNEQVYKHPDFRTGKSGIEKKFDKNLRGQYGVRYVEINAYSIPIQTLSHTKSSKGQDVHLTIDNELQQKSYDLLKDKKASLVLMDVHNGEILSYISTPSFDPNLFSSGIINEEWQSLINDPNKPLNNRPITALYPPASTFKLMTAIAAIEEGFNPKERVKCNGSFKVGNRVFKCWKEGGHGKLDLDDAIKHSCNVYFYKIAQEIGFDKIAKISYKFGYEDDFNLNIGSSLRGNIPTPEWKMRRFGKKWVGGDDINAGIGQGFVLANPMQIALATARIANNGKKIIPTIVQDKNIILSNLQLPKFATANKENLEFLQKSMSKVVNEKGGTAYYRRIKDKNFQMAGKTGTSQVVSNVKDGDENSKKDHAIFTAFAPIHKPKFAISVVIENIGFGSTYAAPVARDILLAAQKKYIK
ncbi:penicillin-binding protein 2 [Rickettsiales bacterium]|nr:penicillin-binding protein 2 [Rickettsiales bacterium]MDB2550364.1 penicillin-binding protein 2 [Rickettsiales bacterium]